MVGILRSTSILWRHTTTARILKHSIYWSTKAHLRSHAFGTTCKPRTSYHSSDFTGAGFTATVETGGPTAGPLGKAGSMFGKGLNPKALKHFLDTYVIGQSRPKRVLSVAVYNHYQRAQALQRQQDEEEEIARLTRMRHTHPVEDEFPGQQPTVNYQRDQRPVTAAIEGVSSSHVDIQKSNVLMIGPSGVGKTLMCRTLARILDVPFSISDCTAFTQAGYVGEDADVCVQRLLSASNWDVKKAEMGIICLDEVDKIATAKMISNGRDVSGEGVQQALLKILEGTTLQIISKNERPRQGPSGYSNNAGSSYTAGHPSPFQSFGGAANLGTGQGGFSTNSGGKGETYTIDTSNILFILCGAFNGLEKTIMDRISKHSIGFNAPVRLKSGSISNLSPEAEAQLLKKHRPYFSRAEDDAADCSDATSASQSSGKRSRFNSLELVEPRDLTAFGLIPEFVGRVPIIASLEALNEEMLVRVLLEPRNSLVKQYEELFNMSGVELKFTSPALREIARVALGMETGARGLRTVLERILTDAMYESPSSSIKYVLINAAVAKLNQPPIYFARGQQDRFHALIAAEEGEWAAAMRAESHDLARAETFEEYREKEKATGFI